MRLSKAIVLSVCTLSFFIVFNDRAALALSDIVLYASEAPLTVGNWFAFADVTAAGGARMSNPDAGRPKLSAPLATPANYFEMNFNAQSGVGYRLWIRGKAESDSPYNDSVFVQFSSSVDAGGVPVFRIGTDSATTINLEDCLGCGVSGWGWQDNGWGSGVLGPLIYFQMSGAQTLRIQTREDGLSIDQIVLSPQTYADMSPGLLRNDTTILPKSSSASVLVNSVSPASGPATGGTSVTIAGSGFASGATVTFGGTPAGGVMVTSTSSITATTPPNSPGSVNVTVTNGDGQSGTLVGGFTYVAANVMPQFGHVFIVVEENHSYSDVIGSSAMPYLNSLASRYGLATNYFANTHPSIGNYFWLTTGQNITNDSNFTGVVTADNIVRQLLAGGKTWKTYAEDLPSVGYTGGDQYPYVKRHNPFAYISDVLNSPTQTANLVPFSQFATNLAAGQLPKYSFIIPNQFNNAHDCPPGNPSCTDAERLATLDNWLRTNIAPLLSSATFQQDGLLIITFDESVGGDNAGGGGHVATLVISPRAKPSYRSTAFYQHQSLLRMSAQALGLTSFPGASATAPDMTEFFDTSSSPAPLITSVTPASGPTSGGTLITIMGSGFAFGATVMLDGIPATAVDVQTGSTIRATTPTHQAGSVNVTVTNTNGRSATLAGGFTYLSSSSETVLLSDDFNDGTIDQAKWVVNNVFSGFTDSSVPVNELNQRLQIGPLLRNSSGSHYNGLRSASRFDFTGAYCYVSLLGAPASGTSADAMLTIGVDVNDYYRIYVEGPNLICQKRISAAKSTLFTVSYDPTSHRYMRIRHDSARGDIVFETAADSGGMPGAWSERYRETWNTATVTLNAIQFELKAGTFTSESVSPGTVIFDSFRAARP